MEILFVVVLLMASWHGLKYGVPRGLRAVAKQRRSSINKWNQSHPNAPASARWGAAIARTAAMLRWGPRHLGQECKKAFTDAWDEGKRKYRVGQPAPAPTSSTPTDSQPTQPQPPAPPAAPGRRPGHLQPVPDPPSGGSNEPGAPNEPGGGRLAPPAPRRGPNPMPIATATGGEVKNAEQFMAEAKAVEAEAAADLEDAGADLARAKEDQTRIEQMVASLKRESAMSSDITAVEKLTDPAAARVNAATARQAAADQRLAGAKAVVTIAARHVELIGRAVGSFYQAA